MKIKIYSGFEQASQAQGLVVIVDVLRAATVDAYLLAAGVKSIRPVSLAKEAFLLKEKNPDLILVGEEGGYKIPGFDIGNSPAEITSYPDLLGKTAVHRSGAGTQGLVRARQDLDVIFASFVCFSAIKKYILKKNPSLVSIVATDVSYPGLEDELFAEYLKQALLKEDGWSMAAIVKKLENHPRRVWFLDPAKPEFSAEDFCRCLELDKFNFVPLMKNGQVVKIN